MEHPNFYESIAEARMRLDGTVVLYDGDPHFVLTVCDHKPDGIFRVYLDPLLPQGIMNMHKFSIPYDWYDEHDMSRGEKMDEFMENTKDNTVLRKTMNSPLFKKFRPFPLGMANHNGSVSFVERIPTRHTQQGLTTSSLSWSSPDVFKAPKTERFRPGPTRGFDLLSYSMYDLIKGNYPSVEECVEKLNDPKISNTAVAFSREFALVRGPLGLLFLAYKSDLIGYLPNSDLSMVKIDTNFTHVKEAVDELGCFNKIF